MVDRDKNKEKKLRKYETKNQILGIKKKKYEIQHKNRYSKYNFVRIKKLKGILRLKNKTKKLKK